MARYLSDHDLEAIAARVVRAYRNLPEVREAGQVLYVDAGLLLKNLLGLSIENRHLSEDGSTLGVTAFEEVGVEIFDGDEDLFFFDGKTVEFHPCPRRLPPRSKNAVSEGLRGRREREACDPLP